ncbi:MAG: exosortase H-associated membrane protein [Candidatus Thiodiazotropha sp. 6PLUC9]
MLQFRSLNPVAGFILRVIIWLPVCLAGWYYLAPSLVWPVSLLSDWLLTALFPDLIQGVEQLGDRLDIVTLLPLPAELMKGLQPGSSGDLVFTINPLIYSYGLPLFTALAIAAPENPSDEDIKWRNWLWGLPLLLAAQVWGICFDVLKTLIYTLGPEISNQISFSSLEKDGVALGYQLGYLIFPSVLPLTIWVVQYRAYLADMVWGSPTTFAEPKSDDT